MLRLSVCVLLLLACVLLSFKLDTKRQISKNQEATVKKSGNPVFEGWYADPEGAVFGNEYWVYPTCSDDFEKQLFFDPFSSNISGFL